MVIRINRLIRISYSVLFLLLYIKVNAQEVNIFDQLPKMNYFEWEDISYLSSVLIPNLFENGKLDSVETILRYWEKQTGLSEPIYRFRILFSIYKDRFEEEIYDDEIMNYLLTYYIWINENFNFLSLDERPFLDKDFNDFTVKLANQLISKVDRDSEKHLICEFYRNNFNLFYNEIKSSKYNHTKLKSSYKKFLQKIFKLIEGNLGFYVAYSIPKGEINVLGNHPEIGIVMGIKKGRFVGNYIVSIMPFNSKKIDYYDKIIDVDIKPTEALNLGIDIEMEFLRLNRFSLNVVSGFVTGSLIADQYIMDENVKDQIGFNGIVFNFGMGFKYYLDRYWGGYVNLQAKYSFVKYYSDNEYTMNSFNLGGNTLKICLTVGFYHNKSKLTSLKYIN